MAPGYMHLSNGQHKPEQLLMYVGLQDKYTTLYNAVPL